MIADILAVLAAVVHGGPLIAFALLINFRRAIPRVADEDVIRVYRAFGGDRKSTRLNSSHSSVSRMPSSA